MSREAAVSKMFLPCPEKVSTVKDLEDIIMGK